MNDPASVSRETNETVDSALIALLAEFTRRTQAGEVVDPAAFLRAHPDHADQLRQLLPTVQGLANLGRSAGALPASEQKVSATDVPVLADYQILRQVGHGGMGVVYEAVQVSLGRHVALKVLPGHGAASGRLRERFRREAQAAARLHHTNIVPIFGVGEEKGVHFYVMQFIEGRGLDAVLAELRRLRERGAEERPSAAALGLLRGLHTPPPQPAATPGTAVETNAGGAGGPAADSSAGAADTMPALTAPSEWYGTAYFRAVARLGVQAAEALAYAHKQGVLHRDVKPSNLLLDEKGTVWVADFGLARIEGLEDLTGSGEVVGTLRYLAPERFRAVCDARSDVYALGLTLYELLTLRPAFADSDRARLVQRLLHEQPAPPRQADPRIPRDLETIVLKAIDREPGRRYQTAGELAADLERFLADRPIRARPIRLWTRLAKWARRQPVVAALSAAVLLALLGLVGLGAVSYEEIRAALDKEEKQRKKTEQALVNEERAHQRAQKATEAEKAARKAAQKAEKEAEDRGQKAVDQAYYATLSEVEAMRLAHPHGWRGRALSKLHVLAGFGTAVRDDLQLRSEVLACLSQRDLEVRARQNLSNSLEALAVGPAGTSLVTLGPEGTLRWWEVGDPARPLRLAGQALLPAKLRPAKPVNPRVGSSPRGHALAFLPDGLRLACATQEGVVLIERAHAHRPARFIHGGPATFVSCDRHGRLVAGWEDGRISGHEAGSAETLWQLPARVKVPPRLAVAPSGSPVALVGENNSVQLYRPGKDDQPRLLGRHHGKVEDLAFSGDGRFLASAAADGTVRVWSIETGQDRFIFHAPGPLRCVAFSPDATLVATAGFDSGLIQVHDALTGRSVTEMARQPGVVRLAFTPDGTHLALARRGTTGGPVGEVVLCRLAGCPERRDLPSRGSGVGALASRGTDPITDAGALAFHPHQPWVATGDARRGLVDLWDCQTGLTLKRWAPPAFDPAITLAFSPDGSLLAAGSLDGLTLYEVQSGKRRALLVEEFLRVSHLAWGADGKHLLVHALPGVKILSQPAKVLHVEVETGQVRTLQTFDKRRALGVFLLDRSRAVVVLNKEILLLDVAKGEPIREVPVQGVVRGCTRTADGKALVLAVGVAPQVGRLELWSLPGLERLRGGPVALGSLAPLAASRDGRWVAVGAPEGRLTLHDARTLAKAVVFPVQRNPLPFVAFAPDDRQLAVWGVSGDVTLYDLPRLREGAPDPRLAWDAVK